MTSIQFAARESRDLIVAWLALGLAFTFFFEVAPGRGRGIPAVAPATLVGPFAINLLTVGVAFLGHELAHKVVAVRFGQAAEFRADYGMLFLAVVSGLAGFIFAAPGAVHHRGWINTREHGLIALAGPLTNIGMAVVFLPLVFVLPTIGARGVGINLLLAGFNMLPIGGLDGATVREWSTVVYLAVFIPAAVLAIGTLVFGLGF